MNDKVEQKVGLMGIPVEFNYVSTTCPNCGCTISIPTMPTDTVYLRVGSWACPKCGQLGRVNHGDFQWTSDKITLAIDANKFIEQQVYSAQKRLDKLLKAHDNMGIRLMCGSRNGVDNDLVIAQVFATRDYEFATRDCEGDSIWTGVEDDIETLLIHIKQWADKIDDKIIDNH